MTYWNRYFNQTALTSLYYSGLHKILAPITRGNGIIFTLHQIEEQTSDPFSPNSILKITPQFLEETINIVRTKGFDIISLDEMHNRLKRPDTQAPYAVFTFDDGYKDNRDLALKVFEKYNIPLALYIVSDYSSGEGELWWLALEKIIQQNTTLKDPFSQSRTYSAKTTKEKEQVYDKLYWQLRSMDQTKQRESICRFANDHNFDILSLTKDLIMDWQELRELNKHPLVTLGAHTKSHFALSLLSEQEAIEQIVKGVEVMKTELGQDPQHFSYPYGDANCAGPREFAIAKELGFKTAVTTRKGVIYEEHKKFATALPRVSLNGEYQKCRYVETFMSGAPFCLANGLRRLNVN